MMTTETPRGRAPSIRDVARLAGVSHQTVSRVLNDSPSLRAETRQRVLDVMEQVQYRPNRAARALVTSRSRTIGVLTAQSSQYGPASSIAAIEAAAREAGYLVTTTNLAADDEAAIQVALATSSTRRSRASWSWRRRCACARSSRACPSTTPT